MIDVETRYNFGGDEFIFVELSQEMNLEVNFKTTAITNEIKLKNMFGVIDICPAHASYLIRFDPDKINGNKLIQELKKVEESVTDYNEMKINTRIVDVPVYFEDPWTHETVMEFRDRHQDPNLTDLEYAAKVNGYKSKEGLIEAIVNTPFLVSMIGFVPGLPFCFQLVKQEEQIEVPKYIRPRTYTPERCFAFGGGFAVIYPATGTGGAQMLGITPNPVFNKKQDLPDFKDSMVFPRQGDIFAFRNINREEYDEIREQVNNGTFEYYKKNFTFTPAEVLKDLSGFSKIIKNKLYHS